MHMRDFLGENARWLAAGVVLTFSSSFGQTFFVSLFGAEIRAELGLSHGGWGGAYTMGTVASAILLTFVGGLADRFRVRMLALIVMIALAVLCLGMAWVSGFAMLALVIFGLRFLGQGALSHIAITAMGRWFNANRGRAMAIAALGFSLGESLLPLAGVAVAGVVGWRGAWVDGRRRRASCWRWRCGCCGCWRASAPRASWRRPESRPACAGGSGRGPRRCAIGCSG